MHTRTARDLFFILFNKIDKLSSSEEKYYLRKIITLIYFFIRTNSKTLVYFHKDNFNDNVYFLYGSKKLISFIKEQLNVPENKNMFCLNRLKIHFDFIAE